MFSELKNQQVFVLALSKYYCVWLQLLLIVCVSMPNFSYIFEHNFSGLLMTILNVFRWIDAII